MQSLSHNMLLFVLFGWIACTSCQHSQNEIGILEKKAKYYYEQDRYVEAYKAYSRLINIDTSNGEFYFNKGGAEIGLQIYNEARKDLFHAIALNYRTADCYYNIGLTYLFKNDSLALKYLNKTIELNPNHKKAPIALGFLKAKMAHDVNH